MALNAVFATEHQIGKRVNSLQHSLLKCSPTKREIQRVDPGTTVLVAEDSLTQALRIQYFLEQAGLRVVMARNGREALAMIRQTPPDLVATDLNMPEMDGLELVAAAQAEFPELPIVLLTAAGSESMTAEALYKGATSYVPKQFLHDLIPTLRRLLAVVQAERGSAHLDACSANSELQYCLTNHDAFVAPLIARFKRLIQGFEIRKAGGALRVAIALDEALQNAIVHGNLELTSELRESDAQAFDNLAMQRRQQAPFKDRCVHVRANLTTQSAEFVIRDDGPGFDPKVIPDPTDPKYFDRPCGRGLCLIHAFMDDVRHNDQGNEITMTLRKQGE